MFTQILLFVASFFLSRLLAKKPKAPAPPAVSTNIKIATADANKSIPVVFGTIWCEDPNVVWYGDLGVQAIRR